MFPLSRPALLPLMRLRFSPHIPSFALLTFLATTLLATPKPFVPSGPIVPLWPGDAPGSEGKTAPERWVEGGKPDGFHRVTDIHRPSLTVYLPAKPDAHAPAVIIAPGGGHRYLVVDLEGEFVAKKLNEFGIAAFVLRSRLARAEGSTYKPEVESLADLHQALRVVRARATEWHVNPARIGVMGFSAGGHLAALAQNAFEPATRPDFAVLCYPAYIGAATPLAKNAPPAFLFVNDDDTFATGAAEYYLALRKAKIPAELHVFRRGGHGIGATGRSPDFEKLGAAQWPNLLRLWLTDLGVLSR